MLHLSRRHACAGPAGYKPAAPRLLKRQIPATATAQGTVASPLTKSPDATWDLEPVVIVGAGIAGLATAVALHKVGIPARVLEAADNLRVEGTAIGLWDNAWRALDALGVADTLRPKYLALNRMEVCRAEAPGRVLRNFGFAECEGGVGSEFRGVHRGALLQALAEALPPGTITYNSGVSSIQDTPALASSKAPVRVQLRGSAVTEVECGVLVGADGVRSVTAKHIGLPEPKYSGYVAYRGVAKLGPGGMARVRMPRDSIRMIWGAGQRAGLYPLSDEEMYWFVTYNAPPDFRPSAPELMGQEVKALLAGWDWGVDAIVSATAPEAMSCSRIADRWDPSPWGHGMVTLAGDAAHPMTPNLGQGGCTALEDAVVLGAELKAACSTQGGSTQERVAAALRRYEQQRAKRCVPLTVRASVLGTLLQQDAVPICTARDAYVSSPFFAISHFLDHCNFDVRQAVASSAQGNRV